MNGRKAFRNGVLPSYPCMASAGPQLPSTTATAIEHDPNAMPAQTERHHTNPTTLDLRPPGSRRRLRFIIGTATLLCLPVSQARANPPRALPRNASHIQAKWQPAMDYDRDGCYPTPAIGPDGRVNPGLKPSGSLSENCRDASDLNNTNAYARSCCGPSGWCGHLYGFYFEKDQVVAGFDPFGHRHDWEHVIVWVNDAETPRVPAYVSVSAHGRYETRPISQVRMQDSHPKIVYHKDGPLTHTFRFAAPHDEPPENHKGTWQYPDLVSWEGYPSGVRDILSRANFGTASFALAGSEQNLKRELRKGLEHLLKSENVHLNPLDQIQFSLVSMDIFSQGCVPVNGVDPNVPW